jgi:hypothetical protein
MPILFASDESELLAASRTGDATARKRLFDSYLELAALLALRLGPVWMRPLDAIQGANVVLGRLLDDGSVISPVRELTPVLVKL